MLSQISLIFILFIILLSTVLIFTRNRTQENFDLPTQTAANVPAMLHTKGKDFYVGNIVPEANDVPIVSPHGKYEFRKMQLLYDGVWGEKCALDGRGNENCNWEVMDGNCPLGKDGLSYGGDKYFHNPIKVLRMGEKVVKPPECPINMKMYRDGPTYEENMINNPPIYLEKPTMEDILGFPEQDNEIYFPMMKNGVIVGKVGKVEGCKN